MIGQNVASISMKSGNSVQEVDVYLYNEVMKKDKRWFERRMQPRKPGGKACSFKEDDILRINMGAMQVANELKSIEFTL